jgi:hypothetical protein
VVSNPIHSVIGAALRYVKRYRPAGPLLASATLLKPQYALLTIWFAARRRTGALVYANLSINGLLNRALLNGNNLTCPPGLVSRGLPPR